MIALYRICFFWCLIIGAICVCATPSLFCQGHSEDEFIYDAEGRRDPFIPLLDKDSTTGLRTIFAPPKQRVELPLRIDVKGILWNGIEYFAIINDEVLKKGETIGEVKIKEIDREKVILEYSQREFPVFLMKKEK